MHGSSSTAPFPATIRAHSLLVVRPAQGWLTVRNSWAKSQVDHRAEPQFVAHDSWKQIRFAKSDMNE